MKKTGLIISLCLIVFSCDISKKESSVKNAELVMYKPSEMALLMNEMYIFNEKTKEKIIKNEDLGEFPANFLNIHSAILTDPTDRNSGFEGFSQAFLLNQKAVFSEKTTDKKEQFNVMVNSCVACHKTTCIGPIPKIKKLLIP
jgi:cytochrome c553